MLTLETVLEKMKTGLEKGLFVFGTEGKSGPLCQIKAKRQEAGGWIVSWSANELPAPIEADVPAEEIEEFLTELVVELYHWVATAQTSPLVKPLPKA